MMAMSPSHSFHAPILENGLADECERCSQIASDPFGCLDPSNLNTLVERTRAWMRDEQFPRSKNETTAMRSVESIINAIRMLETIGAWPFKNNVKES